MSWTTLKHIHKKLFCLRSRIYTAYSFEKVARYQYRIDSVCSNNTNFLKQIAQLSDRERAAPYNHYFGTANKFYYTNSPIELLQSHSKISSRSTLNLFDAIVCNSTVLSTSFFFLATARLSTQHSPLSICSNRLSVCAQVFGVLPWLSSVCYNAPHRRTLLVFTLRFSSLAHLP